MRQQSIAWSIRIAAVLVTLGTGRAFGGFTDMTSAAQMPAPIIVKQSPALATTDKASVNALGFDLNVNAAATCASDEAKLIQHPAAKSQSAEPAVTAPLPDALVPGLVMIGCTFVAARVFKRRLV